MVKLMEPVDVWEVTIISEVVDNDTEKTYHVSAKNVGQAEKKALALAAEDGLEFPACISVSFYMRIDG